MLLLLLGKDKVQRVRGLLETRMYARWDLDSRLPTRNLSAESPQSRRSLGGSNMDTTPLQNTA